MRELTPRADEGNVRHLDGRWVVTRWPAVAQRLAADRFAFEWQAFTAAHGRVLRRLAAGRFRGPGPHGNGAGSAAGAAGSAEASRPLPVPNNR